MPIPYDADAPKIAIKVSMNSDLLAKLRSLKINLSATLEQALQEWLAQAEAERWSDENKAAIKEYNEFVAQNGCFSDEFRSF